jgi:tetratricopeptide (TPR) repeat protein
MAAAVALGLNLPAASQNPSPAPQTPLSEAPASPAEALNRWTARTQSHPDDLHAWIQLGDALMQQSREHPDASLSQRAELAYQTALDLDPRQPSALLGMAWVSNSRHDFNAGRRYAREALAIDPRLPDAFALLGDAAVESGDYDEAFDHYQSSMDIRPDLSSYSRAAHLLWLTGDARRAKTLMLKAIAAGGAHAENTAWCRAELALMMFHQGALLPAEKQIESALALTPNNPHILAAMGRIKTARKNYSAAIECYERAIQKHPQHTSLAALVDLYQLTARKEKAASMSRRILGHHHHHDDHDDHDDGHHHHEDAYHAHGNAELARFMADHDLHLDRALREAEQAYETFKNVYVADTLAWCYHKSGRSKEAARLIRRALKWGTPDASLLFHAGMIHARLGDRPAARKYLYQALSLNPHFHPVHADLATATLKELAARSGNEVPLQIATPASWSAPQAR